VKSDSEDCLISLEEAARLLDYSISGLRKIVSRTKAGGLGPKIQFFQVNNGPIKFRREWVADFINANTVSLKSNVVPPLPKNKLKPTRQVAPQHGFDPSFFRDAA
jgi:hypothetical protein